MTIWHELQQAKTMILRIIIFFIVAVIVILTISVEWVQVFILTLPVPGASGGSIPAYFIQAVRADLVPQGVNIAATTPLESFGVFTGIAGALALALTFIYALWEGWLFARSGLYPRERRGLAVILLICVILMYAGALFAYNILIPVIYTGLFAFIPPGIVPLYGLGTLVWQVIGMMLACALAFLLPVGIFLCAVSGIVPLRVWRAYWRHVFFALLIIIAIITPDGSGLSTVLMLVPIIILYALGYVAAAYFIHLRQPRRPL